jgi:hypothetical protein
MVVAHFGHGAIAAIASMPIDGITGPTFVTAN